MSEETPKPDLQQQGEDKPAEQQQATEGKPAEQQQASDDTPAEQQQATGDKLSEQQPGSEDKPEEKPAADPQEKPTEQEATAATEQPHEVRNETDCAAMQYTLASFHICDGLMYLTGSYRIVYHFYRRAFLGIVGCMANPIYKVQSTLCTSTSVTI